ncbi:MAG: DUF2202 domain-containing protein [Desulfobacterales bacterium]|nr:DUF2202 domain-containing protein [Desulfobacterales bacterium]
MKQIKSIIFFTLAMTLILSGMAVAGGGHGRGNNQAGTAVGNCPYGNNQAGTAVGNCPYGNNQAGTAVGNCPYGNNHSGAAVGNCPYGNNHSGAAVGNCPYGNNQAGATVGNCPHGWGNNQAGCPMTACPGNTGGITGLINNFPEEELSDAETADMLYMREEKKLARDVYLAFYELWGQRVFNNVAQSEQWHMDMMKALLDKYNLEDPAAGNEKGVFTDQDIQTLYTDLVEKGQVSLVEALKAGASVEELDIFDLKQRYANADNTDIKTVYQNMTKASENHLRAFVSRLELFKESYEAQHLSSEELESIINSSGTRGMVDEDGTPLFNNQGCGYCNGGCGRGYGNGHGRGRWSGSATSIDLDTSEAGEMLILAHSKHGSRGHDKGCGNGRWSGSATSFDKSEMLILAQGGRGGGKGNGSGNGGGRGNGGKGNNGGNGSGDGTGNGGNGPKDGTGPGSKSGTCINS